MTSETPHASVVIPAHNAEKTLGEQLEALMTQSAPFNWEVLVVLNRCTDGTKRLADRWAAMHAHIHVVSADEHAGASYARNVGAARARSDRIVFCDADDVVRPGWLAAMVAALDEFDVVGGRLDPLPETPAEILAAFPQLARQQRDGLPRHHGVAFPMTASMACRRDVILATGGFDERFPYGYDDIVFGLLAQREGYRLGFTERARCGYRVRDTVDAIARQRAGHARSRALYIELYEPHEKRSLPLQLLVLTGSLVGALTSLRSVSSQSARVLLRQRWSEFLGAVRLRRKPPQDPPGAVWRPSSAVVIGTALARRWPHLRRLSPVRRAVRQWADQQPNIDVTVPDGVPRVGGLGLVAPQWNAIRVVRSTSYGPAIRAALEWLEPGDHVLDVGANIGVFSLAAGLAVGDSGTVTLVEPVPQVRQAAEQNLLRHLGRTAEVFEIAAGDSNGEPVTLRIEGDDGLEVVGCPTRSSNGRTTVAITATIDEIIPVRDVALIRIVVAGQEAAVLRGAVKLLEESPKAALIVRLNPSALAAAGSSGEDLLAMLEKLGEMHILDADFVGLESSPAASARTFLERCVEGTSVDVLVVPAHRRRSARSAAGIAAHEVGDDGV